jgi:hypothetical protein
MNETLLGALAALTGSALGGIAPIVGNYLIQRGLTERELLTRELSERQALYSNFIQLGITLYVRATTKAPEDENLDDLVQLYATVSRIHFVLLSRSSTLHKFFGAHYQRLRRSPYSHRGPHERNTCTAR